jgi:hypothetical protein
MAGERDESVSAKAARRALSLITEAMDLLDAHGVDPDASAYLAIAQQRLRHTVANSR